MLTWYNRLHTDSSEYKMWGNGIALPTALYCMQGIEKTKRELADGAIYLERTLCNEDGGIQDQIASSFGGFNRIDFSKNGYGFFAKSVIYLYYHSRKDSIA